VLTQPATLIQPVIHDRIGTVLGHATAIDALLASVEDTVYFTYSLVSKLALIIHTIYGRLTCDPMILSTSSARALVESFSMEFEFQHTSDKPRETRRVSMQCKDCKIPQSPILGIACQCQSSASGDFDLPQITLVLPPDVRLIDKLAERAVQD
jgi:hypothetical protein